MSLPDSVSEEIIDIITSETHYFSFHTADPGKTGANEALVTDITRAEIEPYDWNDPEDDPSTEGRRQRNAVTITWGDATGIAELTHIGAWTAAVGGEFKGGWPLANPFTTVNGKEIFAPPNMLEVYAH